MAHYSLLWAKGMFAQSGPTQEKGEAHPSDRTSSFLLGANYIRIRMCVFAEERADSSNAVFGQIRQKAVELNFLPFFVFCFPIIDKRRRP
jgi:hypothetical protein